MLRNSRFAFLDEHLLDKYEWVRGLLWHVVGISIANQFAERPDSSMPEAWGDRPLKHPQQSERQRVPSFTPSRVRGLVFDGVAVNGNLEAASVSGLVFTQGHMPFFGRGHDLVLYRDASMHPRLVVCLACARYASKRWAFSEPCGGNVGKRRAVLS
eukprot:6011771-Amphidinium_carterae.1